MDKVILQARDGASAEIVTHGAHVCSWKPANGNEQLFLSRTSEFRDGAAIRGGVPVVFPQFSNLGPLPKHGFARTAIWRLVRSGQLEQGAAQAVFELQESIASLQLWPHVFRAELVVTVAEQSLQLDFSVVNNGDTELSFHCALHTYFQVDDIQKTRVHGLAGLEYRDTVSGQEHCHQTEEPLTISSEIDRIYADVIADIAIEQPQQVVQIRQSGFNDAVVWNPGADKGAQLSDLEADGYRRMLCVEAASIMQPIRLAPGQVWSGMQLMSVVASEPVAI
ncbi:D-hexose-6-phosphate mutarotase [Undibacterium seohonense]|jgi:glucose-6-phosphate 1-epimerase|uniref:Putative glucose-6-phosphate 1-epimerase n=1 Tax=Undibacterium seohonense TaxID=1344950 RepID=A0ABR6X7G4_9BURK|nr:D-hexose-6-phosphate mutarotase [Undibacterium seohonense]MBC3808291.1 D-hexose-6-phosphate mutarotase [Undibacterium seohonense]